MAPTPQPHAHDSPQVVDLGPLAAACRELVGWYDQLIAGEHPPIHDLDRAITALQLLPRVGGRIGRDIDIIVAGGARSSYDEIIGAVERLRTIASHSPSPDIRGAHPRKRTRQRRPAKTPNGQTPLPGLEPPTDEPPGAPR